MKSKKLKIDGVDIEIIKFNPLQGGTLLMKTTAMFSSALKEIVSAIGDDLSESEQMEVFMGALQGLFDRNTPEEVMDYIQSIVATGYVIANKKKVTHIDDFESLAGDDGDGLHLASMVLFESIKYNFSKFLGKFIPALAS